MQEAAITTCPVKRRRRLARRSTRRRPPGRDWACGSARARPQDHRRGTVPASATRTTRTCRRRSAKTRRRAASSRRPSARPLAPVGGRLSLPARMISDGSDPRLARGGVAPGVAPGATPPHSPSRASGEKGRVAPVFPLSAGAARVGRSRTKNPNRNSGKWKVGVEHSPPRFVVHPPPSDRVPFRAAPTSTPASTPERSRRQVNITFVIPPPRD